MIYLIRHGESEANARGLFAGQRDDSSLTEKGRAEAKQAGQEIRANGLKIHRVIVSPLKRARESAEIIAGIISFPLDQVKEDKRLAEYDMGEISGQPIHAISSAELVAAKNAENPLTFQKRV